MASWRRPLHPCVSGQNVCRRFSGRARHCGWAQRARPRYFTAHGDGLAHRRCTRRPPAGRRAVASARRPSPFWPHRHSDHRFSRPRMSEGGLGRNSTRPGSRILTRATQYTHGLLGNARRVRQPRGGPPPGRDWRDRLRSNRSCAQG